jgi:hypothetical protein
MPNAYRGLINDDEELLVIWVPLWSDDVSANRTKQFNKHLNIYMANGNLPGALLQQEFFVHFVSTSGHASTPEQMSAVLERIECVIVLRDFLTQLTMTQTHTQRSTPMLQRSHWASMPCHSSRSFLPVRQPTRL